ncbi:MAG: FAD-binding oxidoreductase [Micavibrio sp.]
MAVFINPRDRFLTDDLCLYRDLPHHKTDYPALEENAKADICVIGGGFTGVLSACYLAQAGFDVILLERHRIGWGASGRNSGQAIPGFNWDIRGIAARHGEELAAQAYKATLDALLDLKSHVLKSGIACDWQPGLVMAGKTEKSVKDLEDYKETVKRLCGHHLEMIDAARMEQMLGTGTYRGGLLDDEAGRFNPLKYVNGMADMAVKAGVRIYEETPALSLEKTAGGKVSINTPRGTVTCAKTILAGDAYQGWLMPDLRAKYVLLRTSMLATRRFTDDEYAQTIPADKAVFEWRSLLNYFTKTADGRLIFGGGDAPLSRSEAERRRAFTAIVRSMEEIFPHLKAIHITHWWGGYFSVTRDQVPEIGCIDNAFYYAFGYSGHGVVPSHMAARLMAEMIIRKEESPAFVKAMKAPPIPGAGRCDGLLVRCALQWYRVKDMFS